MAIEAENEKEAQQLAKEYIKHDKHDRDINAGINILNKGLQLQSA